MKEQKAKEGEYRIIEEHTNAKVCSIREIELQKEFNYPVDKIQYWKTLKWSKKSQTPQAQAKKVANTNYKQVFESRKGKVDYKAFQAKRVASMDWKARTAKINWEQKVANTDYKMIAIQNRKPINQYDIEGNFIKQWDSVTTICQTLWGNMSAQSNITNCCRGKFKIRKGYIWKYAG
jgi:hypothetical protein